MNTHKTRRFLEFIKEGKDINPKDIFHNYEKVRPMIKKYVSEKDNATLGDIMTGFVTFLSTSKPEYWEKEKKNVANFLVDMPIDTSAIFVTSIDSFERASAEFKYVTKLHVELTKLPHYKQLFYEKVVAVGKAKD